MNAPQHPAELQDLQLHLDHKGDPVGDLQPADRVIEAETDVLALAGQLEDTDVVEVLFETLKDGRGYSHARSLREDLGFRGVLRAVGDVGVDQLHYLLRAGFDTFVLRPGTDHDAARAALLRFSHFYVGVLARPRAAFIERRAPPVSDA